MAMLVKIAWLVRTETEGFWEEMEGELEGEKSKGEKKVKKRWKKQRWKSKMSSESTELKIRSVNLKAIENIM